MVICPCLSLSVPDSCCVYDVVGCGRGILGIDAHQANMKVHSVGCLEVVSHHMRDNVTTLVGLIVATLFVQVSSNRPIWSSWTNYLFIYLLYLLQFVGFVFSFCLANSIKKECEIVWISVFENLAESCPGTEMMKTLQNNIFSCKTWN